MSRFNCKVVEAVPDSVEEVNIDSVKTYYLHTSIRNVFFKRVISKSLFDVYLDNYRYNFCSVGENAIYKLTRHKYG